MCIDISMNSVEPELMLKIWMLGRQVNMTLFKVQKEQTCFIYLFIFAKVPKSCN